jgi:hypothetical protein
LSGQCPDDRRHACAVCQACAVCACALVSVRPPDLVYAPVSARPPDLVCSGAAAVARDGGGLCGAVFGLAAVCPLPQGQVPALAIHQPHMLSHTDSQAEPLHSEPNVVRLRGSSLCTMRPARKSGPGAGCATLPWLRFVYCVHLTIDKYLSLDKNSTIDKFLTIDRNSTTAELLTTARQVVLLRAVQAGPARHEPDRRPRQGRRLLRRRRTHARTHARAHARTRARSHTLKQAHALARSHARTRTRTNSHTRARARTHARTHARTRTRTHASTHGRGTGGGPGPYRVVGEKRLTHACTPSI